jgi:2-succinyl-6-hydroxy-2,4-cyclohexadiene-1-carboxylate synthase
MHPLARIVLVHGFTQTGGSWSEVAADLARDHAVLSPDAPSHGSLATAPAADLPSAARAVSALGGVATYAGYSMGGRICLQLALDLPDLVERLVLVSAAAGIEDPGERAARRASDELLARRLDAVDAGGAGLGLDAFLDEWLAGPLFAHLSAEQSGRDARRANTTGGLAASLRTIGTGSMAPLWGRLSDLAMPVLLVAGALDTRFVAAAEQMAARIPAATLEVVPGAGHAVPFERPGAFAGLVRRFVATT